MKARKPVPCGEGFSKRAPGRLRGGFSETPQSPASPSLHRDSLGAFGGPCLAAGSSVSIRSRPVSGGGAPSVQKEVNFCSEINDIDVSLSPENSQELGLFKTRGRFHSLLSLWCYLKTLFETAHDLRKDKGAVGFPRPRILQRGGGVGRTSAPRVAV